MAVRFYEYIADPPLVKSRNAFASAARLLPVYGTTLHTTLQPGGQPGDKLAAGGHGAWDDPVVSKRDGAAWRLALAAGNLGLDRVNCGGSCPGQPQNEKH